MNCAKRVSTAIALGIASALLAATAGAVDLRDWGKKYATSERFVVLAQFSNQAVLDKETQLVWQTVVAPVTETWYQAYYRCLGASTGGRHGWRLPTYVELASAVGGFTATTMPAALGSVPVGRYWTATEHVQFDGIAYALDVPSLVAYSDNMSVATRRTWCVRGPA